MPDSAQPWLQLLQSKLHVPHPGPGAVTRPRLVERLNEALAQGALLTVIVAPAGYGKSSLLADWVTACGRPVAWLSPDKRDNHLPTFLRYLVAAVRSQFPDACPVTLRAVGAPALPLGQAFIAQLRDELQW
jgi:LuxR family transcriptional regulator, maltose regulon positive regulatory protein